MLTARLNELDAALSYEPTPAHELAEQRIAAALVDAAGQRLRSRPGDLRRARNWRSSSVSHGLQIAGTTTRLDFFELAFGEWLAWLAYLQEYRDTLAAADASFFDTADARSTATPPPTRRPPSARRQLDALPRPRPAPRRRSATCSGSRRAVILAASDRPDRDNRNERPLPSGAQPPQRLPRRRAHRDRARRRVRPQPRQPLHRRAHVVFWSGTPAPRSRSATGSPAHRHRRRRSNGALQPSTPYARSTLGARDSSSPSTSTPAAPTPSCAPSSTSAASRSPSANGSSCTPAAPATPPSPTPSAPSPPAARVTLRIRLAGDDIAGKTITLTHDGTGTLPATATTERDGEATVTYTAPATAADRARHRHDHRQRRHDRRRRRDHHPRAGRRHRHALLRLRQLGRQTSSSAPPSPARPTTASPGTSAAAARSTAPASSRPAAPPGIFTVTAVSLADPSSTGTAFVQVTVIGRHRRVHRARRASGTARNRVLQAPASRWSTAATSRASSARAGLQLEDLVHLRELPEHGVHVRLHDRNGRDGTGGAFSGRITLCSHADERHLRSMRITGSIENGRLSVIVVSSSIARGVEEAAGDVRGNV